MVKTTTSELFKPEYPELSGYKVESKAILYPVRMGWPAIGQAMADASRSAQAPPWSTLNTLSALCLEALTWMRFNRLWSVPLHVAELDTSMELSHLVSSQTTGTNSLRTGVMTAEPIYYTARIQLK